MRGVAGTLFARFLYIIDTLLSIPFSTRNRRECLPAVPAKPRSEHLFLALKLGFGLRPGRLGKLLCG